MNREVQICIATPSYRKEKYSHLDHEWIEVDNDEDGKKSAFREGAKWADNHPYWHKTEEELPEHGFEVRYSGRYCTKSINCRCGFLQRYIAIERKNNDWAVFIKYKSISDYALLCHIKYVHQLQNLLFGLNINLEMEV